ncbi:mechanosensitive ion channel family protein [Gaoshiqia sp. Z1-71]|uniref:mechanosensitive ion channel family protein n=1 Tax=Gaoshiqia hydrogeniformans TaxID=3290090 RepID=UPI003BF8EF14
MELVVFQSGDITYTLTEVILLASVILVATFINHFSVSLVNKVERRKQFPAKFARFIRQGIRFFIWFAALMLSLKILHIHHQSVSLFPLYTGEKFTIKVVNLFIIFLIVYFTRILVYILEYLMDKRVKQKHMDIGRGKSLMQIIKYLAWMIGFIVIIGSLGFQITLVVASISALLVGVGFGLQHIFNDFFSGIIILFDGSIEVNDIVEVEGVVGRVLEIGLRVSKVLTRDNVVIIVPNSRFTGEKVINWTHNEEVTRFQVKVGVAYGSDVRLVERILLAAAARHELIVKEPKAFVRFNDFGESSLDFELHFWTENDFIVESIKSDLRFIIDDEFRRNQIEIPFPQRDLHLKSKHFE